MVYSILSMLLVTNTIYAAPAQKKCNSKNLAFVATTAALLGGASYLGLSHQSHPAKPLPIKVINNEDHSPRGLFAKRNQFDPAQELDSGLLIGRLFSYGDVQKLVESFDEWSEKIPCEQDLNVGLLLFFSGKLSENPEIRSEVQQVIDDFNAKTSEWHKCFRKVILAGAEIPKNKDLYVAKEQAFNPNWVLGPNAQFNALIGNGIKGKFGKEIQNIYLMEPDSVPLKKHWLDALLKEMEEKASFMILGSRYKGEDWVDFVDVLPPELSEHINGNGVYNLTHPAMIEVYNQLQDELKAPERSVAFDVRMAQIVLEDKDRALKYKYSYVIGNYAATYMTPEILDRTGDHLAHGAKLRHSWPEDETIDLVLTHWNNEQSEAIFETLNRAHHPFKKVYVYGDADLPPHSVLSSGTEIIHLEREGFTAGFDWVYAPVKSKWLMYTNSFFSLTNTELMGLYHDGDFAPTIPFLDKSSNDCLLFTSCVNSVKNAAKFSKSYKTHTDTMSIMFKAADRERFIQDWLKVNQEGEQDFPTGDDYLAWNIEHGTIQYDLKNVLKFGNRPVFVRVDNSDEEKPDLAMLEQIVDLEKSEENTEHFLRSTNSTYECAKKIDEKECREACCTWHPSFERCGVSREDCPTPGKGKGGKGGKGMGMSKGKGMSQNSDSCKSSKGGKGGKGGKGMGMSQSSCNSSSSKGGKGMGMSKGKGKGKGMSESSDSSKSSKGGKGMGQGPKGMKNSKGRN